MVDNGNITIHLLATVYTKGLSQLLCNAKNEKGYRLHLRQHLVGFWS